MNLNDIKLSNSQAFQDMFVYFVLNYDNGYFLDIGSCDPIKTNNTFFLEKKGWKGLCIDIDNYDYSSRNSIFICKDLMNNNINDILVEYKAPEIIDYISFDVDAATLKVLHDFDFEKYRFKVMTFEHDCYKDGQEKKNLSRILLKKHGYTLVCSDIGNGGDIEKLVNPYEDWWVDPLYFEKIDFLKCEGKDWKNIRNKIENMLKNE